MRKFAHLTLLALSGLACINAAWSQSSQQAFVFEIERQPIRAMLNEFSKQTGLQLGFFPNTVSVENLLVGPLKGQYTIEQALRELLQDSEFTYRKVNDITLSIVMKASDKSLRRPGYSETSNTSGGRPAAPKFWLADSRFDADSASSRDRARASRNDMAGPRYPGDQGSRVRPAPIEEVIVTGTNIRGVEPSASPLFRYTRQDIDRSGATTVDQFMRTIPQNLGVVDPSSAKVSAAADASTNVNFGAGVDLHGLGAGSTLVLLNGRRLAPSGFSGSFVDISLIPLSAVERIDVLTDGASAIYGSDAVAGVVNFVLKRDLDGAETTARYGDSADGGARERSISQLFGQSWATGNAMAVYEYLDQGSLRVEQRDFIPQPSDLLPGYTLLPSQKRHSAIVSIRQALSDTTELFADGMFSNREYVDDTLSLLGGNSRNEGKARQRGANVGASIALPGDWHLDTVATHSEVSAENRNIVASAGAASLVETEQTAKLSMLDLRLGGAVFSTAAGPARMSLGTSIREEALDASSLRVSADLSRTVFSAYGELYIPIIETTNATSWAESLSLSLAARYDRYDDYGSSTTPKIGVSWLPVRGVNVRATYAESFRAPTLYSLNETPQYILFSVPDPGSPTGITNTIFNTTSGNTSLRAETADSVTAGLDFTPSALPGLVVSATYFDIRFKNRIALPPTGGNFFAIYQEPALGPFIDRAPDADEILRISQEPNFFNFGGADFAGISPALTQAFFDYRPQNIASTNEAGVDLAVTYALRAQQRISGQVFLSATKLIERDYRTTQGLPEVSLLNRTFNPMDFRMRGGMSWSYGDWGSSVAVNYASDYNNDLIIPNVAVGSWTTVDFQLSYKVARSERASLLAGLTLSLNVINLADAEPPYVEYPVTGGIGYDPSNASPRGRFISGQITKAW